MDAGSVVGVDPDNRARVSVDVDVIGADIDVVDEPPSAGPLVKAL